MFVKNDHTYQEIKKEIQSIVREANYIGKCSYLQESWEYQVYCSKRDCATHIKKFLQPYYKWREDEFIKEADTLCIRASINSNLVAKTKDFLEDGEQVAIKLTTISRFDTYSRKATDGRSHIYWIEDTDTIILIEDREFSIVAIDENGLNINVIRIIRDTTQIKFQNDGGVFFHSTACCDANNGIMIMGNKGAGKTTLLFKYILQYGFLTISLDRIFLRKNELGIRMCGWPNSLNLGLGTMRGFCSNPQMKELLNQRNEKRYKTFDPKFKWGDKDKIHLNPYEVTFIKRQEEANLKAIIFAKFVMEGKEGLNRLKGEAIHNYLDENCFSPYDPNFKNWHNLERIDEKKCYENIKEIYHDIINNIPCYEMIYSPSTQPENFLN